MAIPAATTSTTTTTTTTKMTGRRGRSNNNDRNNKPSSGTTANTVGRTTTTTTTTGRITKGEFGMRRVVPIKAKDVSSSSSSQHPQSQQLLLLSSSSSSSSRLLSKTRVCIKNLPPRTTEQDLKEFLLQNVSSNHHSTKPTTTTKTATPSSSLSSSSTTTNTKLQITDCTVLRKTPGGKSRNVAFVGFRTSQQAEYAITIFHRSFLNMTRITVEHALAKRGDNNNADDHNNNNNNNNNNDRVIGNNAGAAAGATGASSKKDEDMTNQQVGKMKKQTTTIDNTMNDDVNKTIGKEKKKSSVDQKVEEILNSMGSGRKKSKFWANDDDNINDTNINNIQVSTSSNYASVPTKMDDDGDNSSTSNSSTSSSEDDDDDDHDEDNNNDEDDVNNNVSDGHKIPTDEKPSAGKISTSAVVSDLDFLRTKQVQVNDFDDDDSDNHAEVVQGTTHTNSNDDMAVDDIVNGEADSDDSSSSSSSSSSSQASPINEDDDVKMKTNDGTKQHDESLSKTKPTKASNNDSMLKDHKENDKTDDDDDDDDDVQLMKDATQSTKTRLFVRNLPFSATEEELEEYFTPYGRVMECHIPVDDRGNNKGYAFITFEVAIDAMEAKRKLDNVDFQGRLLHILEARPSPAAATSSSGGTDTQQRHLTWKQKQELARKELETKAAGGGGAAAKGWSASFVRGDAVVDNLAERLGLRKGELLGVKDKLSSGDAAVRLALGETQIIEENREYFREHGVDMDALVSAGGPNEDGLDGEGKSTKRSRTALLVKNLPSDTKVEELTKLFHVGVDPVNILLPPSRTIALVEYKHSGDAKRAFRNLAYRRFKHVPIYLEWAPLTARTAGFIGDPASSSPSSAPNVSTGTTKAGLSSSSSSSTLSTSRPVVGGDLQEPDMVDEIEDDEVAAEEGEDVSSSTLYVKNLNFETTEETLRKVLESAGGGVKVLSVRIPRKVGPTNKDGTEGRPLSMGYGFVELSSHGGAKSVLSKLRGKLVDGHALELAISSSSSQPQRNSKLTAMAASGGKKGNYKLPTKLMVRNVPFQATRQELLKLFGSFGQLRKVRLPKKFDGGHRGFAFVEFLTGKEAQAAMTALSRTHLYGRHLVLEWASGTDDDDVNVVNDTEARKAKRDVSAQTSGVAPKNKRIRFN